MDGAAVVRDRRPAGAGLHLTVLVYNLTYSALLAAVTFVVGIVPTFIRGATLAWLGGN